MLMETSRLGIKAIAPRNEIGIPRLTQSARRKSEKEGERDEHQQEPGGAGAQHQRQPGAQHLRRVPTDRQRDTVGCARLCLVDVVVNQRGDLERALFAGPENGDHQGLYVVEARELIGLGKSVDDDRDVAEAQPAAVGAGPEHEVFVLLAPVGLADRAKQDLAALGAHRSAWQVERGAPDGVGDLVERQPVPSQRNLRDLDRDLVWRGADDVDLCNARDSGQLISDPLGDRLEGEGIDVARYRDIGNLHTRGQLADDWFLGFNREGRDRIDAALDLVNHLAHVGTKLELDDDGAHPFGSRRLDLLDAVNALDGFLDPDRDRVFDLFRRGAKIGHLDVDPVELDLREDLFPDSGDGNEATHHDDGHHEVCRNAVAGEPFNHPLHDCLPFTTVSRGRPHRRRLPSARVQSTRFSYSVPR